MSLLFIEQHFQAPVNLELERQRVEASVLLAQALLRVLRDVSADELLDGYLSP